MESRQIRRLLLVIAITVGALAVIAILDRRVLDVPSIVRPGPEERPRPTATTPMECIRDPAALPPPPPGPDGRPSNYLHTCGNHIFDTNGREVKITGVNWFGMETGTYAPHGLWTRNWRQILDQIAGLGYNTIRLPYSNEALDPGRPITGVNFIINPDLQDLTGQDMLDRLVAGARERGLKVILDRHRPTSTGQTPLWYNQEVPEERWIADWRMLAARYAGNDTVIAVDLHNEPRADATWGTDDPATDWRLAAERAAKAIHAENPYLLILVEGVESHNGDWYWWGGNLQGVRNAPVRLSVPNRVIYSPHDYGPGIYDQGWFQDPRFPANLPQVWDRQWGYIHREGIAPIVLGEFGGRSVGNDRDGQWQQALVAYLKQYGIGAMTWALNPNSGDTGGLLADDWQTVEKEKQDAYQRLLAPPIDTGAGGAFGRVPTKLSVQYRQGETADQTSNMSFAFRILNDGSQPLDLSRLELRYWYTAGDLRGRVQEVVIDWAAAGTGQVAADVVATNQGGQDHYVRIRFGQGAGAIPPYQTSGDVLVRLHTNDWSTYSQSNDYSFNSTPNQSQNERFDNWDRVTLYLDGKLVWGREP